MKKNLLLFVGIVVILGAGALAVTTVDSAAPAAAPAPAASAPAAGTYSATVYVAGMGGHFAKADVTIDPSNPSDPIKIANLDRVVIGDKTTHPTHDTRIDANDPNTMFWSTYVLDPQGKMHVGKSDLKTGNVIKDVAMTPDAKAPGAKPPLYCASGQSKKFYMPIFMGTEGYVDVFDKATLELKHRVFVSDLGYKAGTYKFLHGINSPDMKKFILVLNEAKEGKGTGNVDFILVDLPSLEKGKMKQLAKNTLKGEPDKTLTFRQYFSADGKYIFQSAADRMWVLDASTLKLVDEKMSPEGSQIHDVMPTPDGKYAVLTVRAVTAACDLDGKPIQGKDITDGTLMLYDAGAKKLNEKSFSTCLACHKGMGLGDKTAVLCGIDAAWKK
ncbi:MAG: hypothetical protein AABZ10_09380 [Nitrospirota bacterium]